MVKKILAVILSLMILTFTAAALAATNSKTNTDISGADVVDVEGDGDLLLQLVKTADTEATQKIKDALTEAQKAGDVLGAFPEDIRAQIPEEHKAVNEMETVRFEGDLDKVVKAKVRFKFETPYKEGDEVTVLLGFPEEDEVAEWIVLDGEGAEEGDVEFTITQNILSMIKTDPFVIVPVSK